MRKFYDAVGFVTSNVEVRPGVYEDVVEEHKFFGDVLRNSRQLENGDKINNDITVSNQISIVANEFANQNIFAIRYVMWRGTRWLVTTVDVEPPRLVLRLGGVYNGPTPVGSA